MTNGNDTKQRILDTAYTLFQQKGYHAVGLNEILKKSGAPKGSLYYYFPGGKEELACQAIQRSRMMVEEEIDSSLGSSDDAKEAFVAHMITLVDVVGEVGAHFSITLLALESMHTSKVLNDECKKFYSMLIGKYEGKLVKCGYEPGEAHRLAVTIQCVIDSAITLSLMYEDMDYLRGTVEHVKTIL